MLKHLKERFLNWFWGMPAKLALSPADECELNMRTAFEKAMSTLTPDDRQHFAASLRLAAASGNWNLHVPALMNYVESMSPDHQIAVMASMLQADMGVAGTLAFARWARNNARHLTEISECDGNMPEFFARVAAA
jgi:hypothetical protein